MRRHGPSSWYLTFGAVLGLGCAQSPPPPAQNAAAAAPAAAAPLAKPAPAPAVLAPGVALRLFPAAEARSLLMAAVTLPSLDRALMGAVALLSRAVPLPLDAAGVKEAMLAQAGLPPQVGENLDTGTPAGAVVVATGAKDVGGLVMAIPAKGVEQARAVIGALGSVIGRRGDVLQVDNGSGGRGWVWQSGNVIVLSDSIDALGRGAMLALDARRAGVGEDLTGVIYPEAIARAYGTNVKTALTTLVAMARMARAAQLLEAEKAHAPARDGGGKPGGKGAGKGSEGAAGAEIDHSLDVLEDLAAYAADVATLEIGLGMDEHRGLLTSLRVNPLPGSALEKLTAEGRPFAVDPVLLRRSDELAFVGASSYGPFLRAQIARQRKRLTESHDKAAPAATQFLDTIVDALEGSTSGAAQLQPSVAFQIIYQLKDAASAAKVAAAVAKLDMPAAMAFLKMQLPADQRRWFALKLKKESVGKVKAVHYTLTVDSKATPAATIDAVKKVFGAATIESYFGVAGTRALVTVGIGKDARAKMAELSADLAAAPAREPRAAPAAPATVPAAPAGGRGGALVVGPNAELTDALVAARGQDSFAYLDIGRIMSLIAAVSDDPRAKALGVGGRAPIPTYVSFANRPSTKQLTFTWTVPSSAFAGAGTILQTLSAAGAVK